jgi:hypothetical protein
MGLSVSYKPSPWVMEKGYLKCLQQWLEEMALLVSGKGNWSFFSTSGLCARFLSLDAFQRLWLQNHKCPCQQFNLFCLI